MAPVAAPAAVPGTPSVAAPVAAPVPASASAPGAAAATFRAFRALLLLAGFYLMGVVLLAAVLGLDTFLVVAGLKGHAVLAVVKLVAVSLAVTVPIVRGMFAFRRPRADGPAGVPVTPGEQPELWAEVRAAARAAGTRPPDTLTLTGDVNAAVGERAHLLGLIRGKRRMYLGVPLLTGLTLPRLRSVLAHEFGHYGHQDTRLSGVTMRGREGVLRTVDAFGASARGGNRLHVAVGNLYVRYARMYLRVSQSVARRQELAADQVAARLGGRDTTAAALREIPALSGAFDFYVERYATAGWDSALLPPAGEFYGGFRRLLADPERAAEVAALRADLPAEPLLPYDSHPPIADRVRLIESLPPDGRPDDPAAPLALSLLRSPAAVLTALESATLVDRAAAMHRVPWAQLAEHAGRAASLKRAEPLRAAMSAGASARPAHAGWARPPGSGVAAAAWGKGPSSTVTGPVTPLPGKGVAGGPGGWAAPAGRAGAAGGAVSLDAVLAEIEAGRLWAIAERLPKSKEAGAATGRAAREFARGTLVDALIGLVDASTARFELSWSAGPVRRVRPARFDTALRPAVEAAVADLPDTAPLRALLAAATGPQPTGVQPPYEASPAPGPEIGLPAPGSGTAPAAPARPAAQPSRAAAPDFPSTTPSPRHPSGAQPAEPGTVPVREGGIADPRVGGWPGRGEADDDHLNGPRS
ncbi:M48 family metalloprotease [Actinacidiphila guanduensis]|uniref:M48 family metalloprotease n=1 Tax=Actinacidiphila guanduensis TaxID=310781 RepID=UPI000B8374F1|nr:M48 family metallopeptidase [Actinacidiphila guanduensis]